MIRFTWREFRVQAIVSLGALLAAAALLAVIGANLAHLYDTTVANCQGAGDCTTAIAAFRSSDSQLQTALDVLMVVIPALIGVFWGAPLLAREFEAGTHRLAWTQSVTRTRWLAVKLGVVGICSLLVTGLLSLMVTWWFSPIDRATMNMFGSFDQRDIVPFGYAAFAFALGVAAGSLLRRTLPAMATTVVGFAAVRFAVLEWVRPNFTAQLRRTVLDTVVGALAPSGQHTSITASQVAAAQGGVPSGAWLISDQTINGAGHVIGQNGLFDGAINFTQGAQGYGISIQGAGTCPDISAAAPTNPGRLIQKCVTQLNIRDALTYQPGSHYWLFQWCEWTIFMALTLILVGLCFWWIRRRAS